MVRSKRHLSSHHQTLIPNNNKSKHWAVLHKIVSWAKKLDVFIFTGLCKEPSRESFCRRRWCAGRASVGMLILSFVKTMGLSPIWGVVLRLRVRVAESILSIKAQVSEFSKTDVSRSQCLFFTIASLTSKLKISGFCFFFSISLRDLGIERVKNPAYFLQC